MAAKPAIGTMIRKARERKLMSQEDLARELRVSRSAVNSWENNRTYPRNRIGALEAVLGISLSGEEAAEPETEWERWERETLNNPDIPPELAQAIVTDARRALRADGGAGAASAPSRPASPGPSAGRHRQRPAG